jgi:hypothetical protein
MNPAWAADSGRVPLTRLSLGEIGGWIEIQVSVNGEVSRWLLDTGSTRHIVSAAFAERHGLAARASARADTALGSVQGLQVNLPTLKLGEFELSSQSALRMDDLRALVGAAGEGLDGILGVPLLNGVVLDLDLRQWKLEITASQTATCPAGNAAIALELHRSLPVIQVQVNGGPAESLLLDTGNPAAVVRISGAEPSESEPGLALPGGVRLALARRVSMNGWQRIEVPVMRLNAPALQRALGSHIAGLAGTALLDGTRWQIDLNQRRACVEQGVVGMPGGFGLTLAQRHGVLYVESVLPNGPAQAAGLRPGDVIQRWVNGPTEGVSLRELWTRVSGLNEIEIVAGANAQPLRLTRTHFAPPLP